MKNYIIFLFLVSSTSVVFGQNSNATKPEFTFVKELIDYGRIEQNSNGNKIFEFTNTGNSPIIITAVKTSCDCTVPKKPERPIMPGEKGTIEVTYDTSKIGGFIKQITIFSNAKLPVKKIRIKGIVVKKKSKLLKEKGLLENN